ncbi:hypothetical protein [Comamonas kerstersii]|uniref:hypothetical protein n=1 Tax=Comamonas kerstersii TaxID=225992 RepID=UPI00266C7AA5|nr:hypothetical protein [Comamonas kerstersii]
MEKKQLSEADIRAKFIDPAILKAGWSETTQIYREYTIARGSIVVRALCQQLREQLTQARHTQSLLAQAWVEQVAA